jgi:hypothetical protein
MGRDLDSPFDDEKQQSPEEGSIKQIAFGNLNITVSKKNNEIQNSNFRNTLIQKTKNNFKIIENEYSSTDSECDEIIDFEQNNINAQNKQDYNQINNENIVKSYNTNNLKNIKIVKTLKNIIKDSTFPERTNIYCWWCCHPFECTPCTMPIKYDSYKNKYNCVGIFCSWNCVKSYSFDLKDQKISERASIITLIIKQLYNLSYSIGIKPAPPRQTLKMFGGYLSIEEFRQNFKGVEYYKLNLFNNNFIYPEINEISNINRRKK